MDAPTTLAGQARESAIPRLLDLHGGKIYGLGLKICGNPDEAQDLLQETFLQAYRKWDRFQGRSDPSSWLYTIASRVCMRRRRRRAGEPRHMASISELLPSGEEGVVDIPSSEQSPHALLERRETREAVEAAIAALPVSFRIPLLLKEIMELSVDEVAAILGLKAATVKTRLHRARLAVARALSATFPRRGAPPPDHSKRMCLDLLRAKQEALDRGVSFPVSPQELCARCRSLFLTLELSPEACRQVLPKSLPEPVRRQLLAELEQATKH